MLKKPREAQIPTDEEHIPILGAAQLLPYNREPFLHASDSFSNRIFAISHIFTNFADTEVV